MLIKVIEFTGTSRHNWTDAVDNAVIDASSVNKNNNIIGVEVTNFKASVKDGHIDEYQANVRISFEIKK